MKLKYKQLYKSVLKEYQQFSKCARLKVAALLVNDGRILCCGYNGTPTGQTNCNELFKSEDGKFYLRETTNDDWREVSEADWKAIHHEFANKNELHAEQNMLGMCLQKNIDVSDCSIVISHEPCESCARLIFAAGIKHVLYVDKYDRGTKGIDFLEANGVKVEQF